MASLAMADVSGSYRRQAWTMVVLSTVGVVCSVISTVLMNTGLFIRPLAESFGWSRGQIVSSLSIGALIMGAANPFVGQLIDRFGSRRMLIASLAFYGASTALIPLLIDWQGLRGLYLGFGLISAFGAGSTIVGYIRLLSTWFSGPLLHSRGFALGCASAGVALGGALSAPVALYGISHLGWAGGFRLLALGPLLVALPISIFFIQEAPAEQEADGGHSQLSGMSLADAMRTGLFWRMVVLVFLIASCLQGLAIHMAPFLQDVGLSVSLLAVITSFNAAIGIPSRLIAGHLFDRFFAPKVAFAVFALPAFGAFLMAAHPVLATALLGSVLLGVGQGAESDLIGYLVSRYFGLRHSGRIFGSVYASFMVGVAFGPFAAARAHDLTKTYQTSFIMATIGLCAICGILLTLPRFPSQYARPIAGGHN